MRAAAAAALLLARAAATAPPFALVPRVHPTPTLTVPDIFTDPPPRSNPNTGYTLAGSLHALLLSLNTTAPAAGAFAADAPATISPNATADEAFHQACAAVGAIPRPEAWRFHEAAYLRAKNRVDAASLSADVSAALQRAVAALDVRTRGTLRVADVGAGLLSMLPVAAALRGDFARVDYHAYDGNAACAAAWPAVLAEAGYAHAGGACWERAGDAGGSVPAVTVTLHASNVDDAPPAEADLVVGCAFADLLAPRALADTVRRALGARGGLVYLPITFAGRTAAVSRGGDDADEEDSAAAAVFRAYHAALAARGHHLDPDKAVEALRKRGGRLLAKGASPWAVPAGTDLWRNLLYFVGLSVVEPLGPDATNRFVSGMHAGAPRDLSVGNVDLLLAVRSTERGSKREPKKAKATMPGAPNGGKTARHLEFDGPRSVVTAVGPARAPSGDELDVRCECSLVSTGTELKVFRGAFGENDAVDTAIEGYAAETFGYPCRYGYSFVGIVEAVGPDADPSWVGARVFAFAPHGDRALVRAGDVQRVPKGVSASDAVYLPAVETALGLAHEAAPLAGERVAVFGLGLIGALAAAVLERAIGGGCEVVGVDPDPRRRAAARKLGVDAVDGTGGSAGAPDVSVEVTGSGGGLQAAVDATRDAGRVVVGSWFGDDPLALRLGARFHRSQLTLKASQVSFVPPELTGRWSKARRFELAWRFVAWLRPSRALTTRRVRLAEAGAGYEALDRGEEVCVELRP